MKQETCKAKQTLTHKPNYKVLGIGYFYKLFLKEKRLYDPSLFSLKENVRAKKHRKPTLDEYRKVIKEFLRIYFMELYLHKKDMYFFLGGRMKIVGLKPWIGEGNNRCTNGIGLLWYMRPSMRSYWMVKLLKMYGTGNQLQIIEKLFHERFDKNILPTFDMEQRKGIENKTLYRCIPN